MLELTDENFKEEVIEAKLPTLVDFWAPWCGPCRAAGPVLEELAKTYEGRMKFARLNVDDNGKTAQNYGILSIPTVIIFKGGEEIQREVGFPGRDGYVRMIEEGLKGKKES